MASKKSSVLLIPSLKTDFSYETILPKNPEQGIPLASDVVRDTCGVNTGLKTPEEILGGAFVHLGNKMIRVRMAVRTADLRRGAGAVAQDERGGNILNHPERLQFTLLESRGDMNLPRLHTRLDDDLTQHHHVLVVRDDNNTLNTHAFFLSEDETKSWASP